MLTPDEKFRLATIKKSIDKDYFWEASYDPTEDTMWLMQRLTELNAEAEKLTEYLLGVNDDS